MIALIIHVLLTGFMCASAMKFQWEYLDSGNHTEDGTLPLYEYNALYDLYNATAGENWFWFNGTGVDSGVPWRFGPTANPCTDLWQGVSCTADNFTGGYRHVTTLQLAGHNLKGTIPNTILNLTHLTVLYLNDNTINGTVPQELGLYMPKMGFLDLSFNQLTGLMPQSICNMTHMKDLNLYSNQLTGTLHACLGNLYEVNEIDLNTNLFSGSIPSTFLQLEKLIYFSMYENHFSGRLEAFMGNFSRMTELSLSTNLLSGTIPDILGSYSRLLYAQLDNNQLTGTVSPLLFTLPALIQFAVSVNQLHGTIPAQIATAQMLTQIYFYGNRFTGVIPSSLGKLRYLTEISMDNNMLSGSIPHALGALQALQYFYLQENILTGPVPSTFSNLSHILEVYLQSNHLTGSLHHVFNASTQTGLTIVQLSDNQLTGSLPTEPFRLPVLNTFVAVSNCFTGTLPAIICNNSQLQSLIVDGLHSASSCRVKILPGLSKSYYSQQGFGGSVPICLFQMANLSTLHISGNSLTGTLPADLDISHELVDLTISHNEITGTVPGVFQQRVWKNLDLSYNRLTGQLASDFATKQFDFSFNLYHEIYNVSDAASAASLSLQNNRLSGIVPHSIVDVLNITVLGSNMFSCLIDKSDLPKHDQGRLNYPCGSDSFNIPYFVWLGVFLTIVVVAVLCTRYTAWVERSEWVRNALLCWQQWSLKVEDLPRNFKYVSAMADILCQISVWCTVLVVIVLVPWYGAASHYYGTYTHQYGWVVSAAFLSGVPPAAFEFVVMVAIILGVVLSVTHLTTKYDREVHYQPDRFTSRSVDGKLLYSKERRTTLLQRLGVYAAYAVVNVTVVVGVNVAFVYVALYQSNTLLILAQVLLSFFKLLWNSVSTPFLIRLIAKYLSNTTSGAGFVSIQVMVALFNNIAVPCLVVAVVSPSCFYNVFDAPPSVDSRFVYNSCADFLDTGCDFYAREIITTTFHPPFRYDYQCSSGILTYYAPAFIYLGVAAAFVLPVMKVAVQQAHKHARVGSRWFHFLDTILPRIFKPLPAVYLSDGQEVSIQQGASRDTIVMPRETVAAPKEARRNILKPYFDANILIITLMTYLGILLTFGVVFPPLAVAMCVTMLSVAWQGRLAVGRFLHNARELNALKFVDIIEQECKGAVTIPKIRRCIFMVVCFCSCFYALFLFDTLGDAQGPRKAIWVLIVLPLLPLLLYIAHQVRTHWLRRLPKHVVEVGDGSTGEADERSVELRPSSYRSSRPMQDTSVSNPMVDEEEGEDVEESKL